MMLMPLAARMEHEAGPAAAQQIRQSKTFDLSRYPPSLHGTVAKAQKSVNSVKGDNKRVRVTAGAPGVNFFLSIKK